MDKKTEKEYEEENVPYKKTQIAAEFNEFIEKEYMSNIDLTIRKGDASKPLLTIIDNQNFTEMTNDIELKEQSSTPVPQTSTSQTIGKAGKKPKTSGKDWRNDPNINDIQSAYKNNYERVLRLNELGYTVNDMVEILGTKKPSIQRDLWRGKKEGRLTGAQ